MKFPEKYRKNVDFTFLGISMDCFDIPFKGRDLTVIATVNPSGWEQVSVSLKNRNPNWDEMCFIKKLFWNKDEVCIQFHPKEEEYVNVFEYCLHIWKPPMELQELLDITT